VTKRAKKVEAPGGKGKNKKANKLINPNEHELNSILMCMNLT